MVMLGTIALTGYLYVVIPEGLFPATGYRPDHRHRRGGAGHLVPGDGRAQEAVIDVVLKDPAVASVGRRSARAARPPR